jgi:transcriptional regulator with XRE-family HTH domain
MRRQGKSKADTLANQKLAFGVVLRRLREEREMTQEQLAWDTQMSRVYISEIERGLREPGLGTIVRLAGSLGLSAAEMIAMFEKEL